MKKGWFLGIGVFFLSTSVFTVYGWNGLIAQNGDVLNIAKWNELVALVLTKSPSSIATNRDDTNISATRYYGVSYADGSWKIDKETGSGTTTVRVTATNTNNTSQSTYAAAWTNRATLNY